MRFASTLLICARAGGVRNTEMNLREMCSNGEVWQSAAGVLGAELFLCCCF